jgi:hypothetical protein
MNTSDHLKHLYVGPEHDIRLKRFSSVAIAVQTRIVTAQSNLPDWYPMHT